MLKLLSVPIPDGTNIERAQGAGTWPDMSSREIGSSSPHAHYKAWPPRVHFPVVRSRVDARYRDVKPDVDCGFVDVAALVRIAYMFAW